MRGWTWSALALRLLVLVAGWASLVLAIPGVSAHAVVLAVASGAAVAPAVFPGRWVTTALELVAVLGWLVGAGGSAEQALFPRLVCLAAVLYLHHTACAWADATPLDAVVSPVFFAHWGRRVTLVVTATAVLALVAVLLQGSPLPRAPVLVPALGVVLALVVAAVPASVLRSHIRRGPSRRD